MVRINLPELKPNEIARFFELYECPHYVKLLYEKKSGKLNEYHCVLEIKSRVDDVLVEWGAKFEKMLLEELQSHFPQAKFYGIFNEKRIEEREPPSLNFFIENYEEDLYIVSSDEECRRITLDLLTNLSYDIPTIIYQPCLRGIIGKFPVSGRADFIIAVPKDGRFIFYVLEAKFTKEEKLFHRFQAITYAYLLSRTLNELGIEGEIKFAVITKGERIIEWPPAGTMYFPQEAEEYILTLEDKLSEEGPFYKLLNADQADLWLTMRCAECPFEPVCIARAVERRDLGLLGIQPGYQKVFREVDINTLDDMADLYEFQSSWPTDFRIPKAKRPDAVSYIVGKTELGHLPRLSKMAQVLKKEIERAIGSNVRPEFIPGTGYNLPAEKGHFYPENSLVRVYIFIQHSPIQDTLLGISAVVENSLTKQIRVLSEVVDHLPESEEDAIQTEKMLLRRFFENVFLAIKQVAPNLEGKTWIQETSRGEATRDCTGDDVFLHLYFYSRFHRDKLMEAVKRHRDVYEMVAVRSFLSLRGAIDQEGYSIIKDELIKRHALRFPPGFGIIPVVHQFQLNKGEAPEEYHGNAPRCSWWGWFNWGGLEQEFEDLFKFLVEKNEAGQLVLAKNEEECPLYNIGVVSFGGYKKRDGSEIPPLYPIFHREDEQIPLYIIWKAFQEGKQRHLKRLLEQLVLATRHIERSIPERSKDKYVKKEPFSLQNLADFNLEGVSLAEVLEEYQKLEYNTRREELKTHYRLPLSVRVLTGQSAVIQVSGVDTRNRRIWGHMVLPPMEENGNWRDYDHAEAPLFSLDESSWVVVTPLENECDSDYDCRKLKLALERGDPAREIAKSPLAVIRHFNRETGEVEISLTYYRDNGPFLVYHPHPRYGAGWIQIHGKTVSVGSYIVIDPAMDDLNMNRAYHVLDGILNGQIYHPTYLKLQEIYSSEFIGRQDIREYRVDLWNKNYIQEFIDILENISKTTKQVNSPNKEQRAFIQDISHFLVSLQGPPGTGKTSGAVAPAILARAYSSIKQGRNSLFIVTGVSHRAIDEALVRTARLLTSLKAHIGELENVELYRVASSENTIDSIRTGLEKENFIPEDYNVTLDHAGRENRVNRLLSVNQKQSALVGQGHVRVIFATPGTIYKLFRNSPPKAELVVIDEASMMDLPTFIMATMGAKERSQILIVGDHRQMQPIQAHNWEIEDRKTIEEHVPFLSVINFIRFLRRELDPHEQKEFEKLLYRDPPQWESDVVRDSVLPIHQLEETHRLPTIAAEMHTELIYEKDGIVLRSKKQRNKKQQLMKIQSIFTISDWVRWVLHHDYPYVIIEHTDTSSTKASDVEARIVSEIVKVISQELEVGVVVPYRAHKARIYKELSDIDRDILVDTVERFQGGEKDIIIVSMASSDPTYLATVFDFIYNQNRFNVAASRMKEKLVLVAARSFFTASAFDLEQFEKVRVWKRFYLRLRNRGERLSLDSILLGVKINAYRLGEWQ
ncbi:bifunctional RecB family nuclease/DEAD/DEAH box helicase [Thermococcus barophilus]|uniref:DNA helicase n=1 Tax=Thermococcus barophilus TaxID=55802 RepID=A0A0S1XE77_THEBA|nr:bifunctional RecB family nuclease/DEAD/DEAH box helicase [Thermococcus barophilus]ALM76050.1 DNA helicase [Thermococcus barophilus]